MATPELTKSVRDYMREIGRKGGTKGGRSKSEAKVNAARANGHKGGRPVIIPLKQDESEQDLDHPEVKGRHKSEK